MHNDSMAVSEQNNMTSESSIKKEQVAPKKKMLNQIPEDNKKQTIMLALGSVMIVLAGVATGWQLSGGLSTSAEAPQASNVTPGDDGNVSEAGVQDTSEFKTEETGVLRKGGWEGEGTHHLEKEGVPAEKYPYLTSAVIDLESFVGKEVKIWGNTIAGQEAGWLVDVGKIKVTE